MGCFPSKERGKPTPEAEPTKETPPAQDATAEAEAQQDQVQEFKAEVEDAKGDKPEVTHDPITPLVNFEKKSPRVVKRQESIQDPDAEHLRGKLEDDDGSIADLRQASLGAKYKNLNMQWAFRPLIFVGVSGSGKRSLAKMFVDRHPDQFAFAISHTTRAPREGETDGKDYYFVSEDRLNEGLQKEEFIQVIQAYGNTYATSFKTVQATAHAGKMCVMALEVEGARQLKASDDFECFRPRYILIKPPSIDELEQRLKVRGDSADRIETLLRRASRMESTPQSISVLSHQLSTGMSNGVPADQEKPEVDVEAPVIEEPEPEEQAPEPANLGAPEYDDVYRYAAEEEADGFFDTVLVNEDLEPTYQQLRAILAPDFGSTADNFGSQEHSLPNIPSETV